MTTVAAIARNGAVHMAADCQTNVYDRPVSCGVPKIVRLWLDGEEVLIGFSGDGAMPGLIAAELPAAVKRPQPGTSPDSWATTVARAITTIAAANGCTCEGRMDSHMILAWRGSVWSINHMMAVTHSDGIAAIGSGEGPAMGAMDAFLASNVHPAHAVRQALHVAVSRDRYSGLPIVCERLAQSTDQTPETAGSVSLSPTAGHVFSD